jgi:Siphovirus Gp157
LMDFPTVDEETVTDTLEGITDLHEMIAAVIRSALVDEALQAGLRTRLEEMRQRLVRLVERSAKKRQLALDAMCDAGLKKLEQPDFTASARAGLPALVVVAEELIPTDYWVPRPPKLDRQSLLAKLKRGGEIAGAQLGNPKPTLAVRTK